MVWKSSLGNQLFWRSTWSHKDSDPPTVELRGGVPEATTFAHLDATTVRWRRGEGKGTYSRLGLGSGKIAEA